ncbi:hypothetical protein KTO58_04345 [Chitinophaga pendula]|nr:hypothetical protein CK934_24855 [Chitinophaga sp. MD30]UCJ08428.1 hypothetical protein KTO58_04345 [Chitinophaga pendula]
MVGIFKTNISTVHDKNKVIRAITANFRVSACSVDIEDCDKVLRIISHEEGETALMEFVKRMGYYCDLLD